MSDQTTRPLTYSLPAAARLLGCSVKTLYRAIEAGKIRVVRLNAHRRISQSELDRLLSSR